ncbi:MAG: nitroreductase family protein, partial [Proteobacteria bacterium]|nr:nitroreductase family protein [Pseudomonadota bacterium]
MSVAETPPLFHYDDLMEVVRRRRSVRRFEKGKTVNRDALLRIAEAGRWGPTGANAQPWDLVIVDDPAKKQQVLDVFLRQSQRLVDHAKGFPAVKKTYLSNTVAIFIVLGDPRWKACFPQATSAEWADEYSENNERIYLASLGAVIQNIQLAVTACGLTSAWLSGGGEDTTNRELSDVLGYPREMEAIGTIPVGYPEKDVNLRYRRPLGQIVHWNSYDSGKGRPDDMVEHYVKQVRPFAMYRSLEDMNDWEDADEILGKWRSAFT